MRPDEHKRRKNAQYKKKHGLTTQQDGQGKKEKTKTTDKKSNDRAKSDGSIKKPDSKHDHKAQASLAIKSKPTDDGSDSDEQVFRRRNLVSNWSRYDDLPDDDDDELPAQRGEDFNKILAAAGGSSAQFRFHDEEEWESMGDSSATTASVLAVNLENLQQSLSCLPLQQRLGICEDLFSESQLKELNDTAASNELLREKNIDVTKTSAIHKNKDLNDQSSERDKSSAKNVKCQTDHSVVDKILENSVDSRNTLQQNIVTMKTKDKSNKLSKASNLDSLKTIEAKNPSKISIPVSEKTLKDGTSTQSNDKEPVIPIAKKNVQKDDTSCLEDDLDMLLSLDKPSNTGTSKVIKQDHTGGDTSGMKEKFSKENKLEKDTAPPAQPIASGKENNLEDWLDSMLDD